MKVVFDRDTERTEMLTALANTPPSRREALMRGISPAVGSRFCT